MTAPQPDQYAAGGPIPGPLPILETGHVISRAQLDALGEAAVRRVLDRLNAPGHHNLADVARELDVNLDEADE